MVYECIFCGRKFPNKYSLNIHLRWCSERKKVKNHWHRFPTQNNGVNETICVISRSKKSLSLIAAEHGKYLSGRVSLEVFWGYLDAMRHLGNVEYKIETDRPRELSACGTCVLESTGIPPTGDHTGGNE
jgi:hypothetical protein